MNGWIVTWLDYLGDRAPHWLSTVSSNVTLTERLLFLPAWLPSVSCPYHGQGDAVTLYI